MFLPFGCGGQMHGVTTQVLKTDTQLNLDIPDIADPRRRGTW